MSDLVRTHLDRISHNTAHIGIIHVLLVSQENASCENSFKKILNEYIQHTFLKNNFGFKCVGIYFFSEREL